MAESMEGVVTADRQQDTEADTLKSTVSEIAKANHYDDDLDIAYRQFLLDIISTFGLLEQAVAQFDARFTLRALRFISTIRRRLTPRVLAHVLMVLYSSEEPQFKYFMSYL
ncbi:26S proteasome non-ATPase regulatory subunit, partial [Cryomyces antarcticus]